MRIHDVSVPLRKGMVVYPGDPPFERELARSLAGGDTSNVAMLRMGAHTGTHVDAPAHMLAAATTVDRLPLDALLGPAIVVSVEAEAGIGREHLSGLAARTVERVLLKTRNSALWAAGAAFEPAFVHLTGAGAAFLVERGVRLVGIDYLGVDRLHSGNHPAHHALMAAGVVIVEGLDLSGVEPGEYELICAPLRIAGGEAAPARVFLVEQ